MLDTYTITENYELPTRGILYNNVPERLTLRSMTTEEEMRRLSHTETPYKTICDIIDSCIIENIGTSTFDMCIGDYQFLLYKLRVVTYGSDYINGSICPFCDTVQTRVIDLDELPVRTLKDKKDLEELMEITLPVSKHKVKLKYQTPRLLDKIERDIKEFNKKYPENKYDVSVLMNLRNCIETVDDQLMDTMKIDNLIRKLGMRDVRYLQKAITKLNNKVGVDITLEEKCNNPKCGEPYLATFRITSEFFGPSID